MPVARYRIVPMQYACQICKKKFDKLDSVKRHHRDKHGAKIQCDFCPYSVARSRGKELDRHMATKHSFPAPVRMVGDNFFMPELPTPTTDSYTLEDEIEENNKEGEITEEIREEERGETRNEDEERIAERCIEENGEAQEEESVRQEDQKSAEDGKDEMEVDTDSKEVVEEELKKGKEERSDQDSEKKEEDKNVEECVDVESKKEKNDRRTREVVDEIIQLMERQVRFKRKKVAWKESGKKTNKVKERVNDRFANDPNFFFLGAPSVYEGGEVAEVLNDAKTRALQAGVSNPKVKFIPSNLLCIQRVEEATLPDGTKYALSSFWIEKPVCLKT